MNKIKFEIKSYVDRTIIGLHKSRLYGPKGVTVEKLFNKLEEEFKFKFITKKQFKKWCESGEVSSAELFYVLLAALIILIDAKHHIIIDSDDMMNRIIDATVTKDINSAKIVLKDFLELIITLGEKYWKLETNLLIVKDLKEKYRNKLNEDEQKYLTALYSYASDNKLFIEDLDNAIELSSVLADKFNEIKTYEQLKEILEKIPKYTEERIKYSIDFYAIIEDIDSGKLKL